MQLKTPSFFFFWNEKVIPKTKGLQWRQRNNISYSFLALDFRSNYSEQFKKHYFLVMAIQEIGEKGKMIKAISQFARETSGVL